MKLISLFFLFCTLSFAGQTPNVILVNQEGKPFQIYDLRGNYVFLSFIYTRCPLPQMCPLTVTLNKKLAKEWPKKFKKKPLKILMLTLDPEYDTPKVMKEFAVKRGLDLNQFVLATSNSQVLNDFGTFFQVVKRVEGQGMIGHNLISVLLSPKLEVIQSFAENQWNPNKVFQAVESLPSTK